MSEEKLLNFKKKLENAKTELAILGSKEKELVSTLNKDFKIKDLKKVDALLKEVKSDSDKMKNKLNRILEKIEDKFDDYE